MKVWTYPEKRLEEMGASRWTVEWWTLNPDAKGKDEIDWDRDITANYTAHKTREAAVAAAKRVASGSFFGCAVVQKQRVDWFVEEDRIAEWTDVGDSEEVRGD